MQTLRNLHFDLTSGMQPAARQWARLIQARLGHHKVSSGCIGPLLFIGRSGGGLRQVELAQQLGVEGPSLVRLLDKLAEQGLVRRESHASDRRAKQLWLTEEGQRVHEELENALTELRQEVLAELSEQELRAALKFYRLLSDAAARVTQGG